MNFSCKIILSDYRKEDSTRKVYLQAIIDRRRVIVPLGFYVHEEAFDERRQCMVKGHPNARNFESEFLAAKAKANNIASKFRQDNKALTPEDFRNEFNNPSEAMDFIQFFKDEMELKRPDIAHNTYRQHTTVINKLIAFKKSIPFNHISVDLMQSFRNHIIKKYGNSGPTINKILKVVKQYLSDARKKGMEFKDPFQVIKIRSFKSKKLSLSEEEVDRLDEYYTSANCPEPHKKLLRYFLFSCYTGVRISDIKILQWKHIHGDLLIFTPTKTKSLNKEVTIPLGPNDKKYLPPFTSWNEKIFDTFADQVSNRYIKLIADQCDIKKKITYHTSRHTFGSQFAENGNIVALQKIMGHEDIKTTMEYVHINTKSLVDAKNSVSKAASASRKRRKKLSDSGNKSDK